MSVATITTQEQIREAVTTEFPFEVTKVQLNGPDGNPTPLFGLFRSDNNKCVGTSSVTHVYLPHTTDDVIALAEAGSTIFDGEAVVQCHWKDGHYVIVEPTRDYRRTVYGTNDAIFPRMVIRAGYDGKAFGAAMGYYRDACRNLAILKQVAGTSMSIRHTSGLRAKIDDLITEFRQMSGAWDAICERIDRMAGCIIPVQEFLDTLYGEAPEKDGKKKTMHQNRQSAILGRISRERLAFGQTNVYNLDKANGWELFNAIQGYEQHDAIRRPRRGNTISMLDRIIQTTQKPKVAEAEKLVLKYMNK